MKKFREIKIGLLIGMILSCVLIVWDQTKLVFGADEEESDVSVWNQIVAHGDFFDWNDVFGPSKTGQDLYLLVYEKIVNEPEQRALENIASDFGLTTEEAKAAMNGSVAVIYNNPDRFVGGSKTAGAENTLLRDRLDTSAGNYVTNTQENAYKILDDFRTEFEDIKELYQLESEIDVLVQPGEIFSNGDLSDSGFDLVHDLSLIEEILFGKKSEMTIGGDYGKTLDSPYVGTVDFKEDKVGTVNRNLDDQSDESRDLDSENEEDAGRELSLDYCSEEDFLAEAFDDFENEVTTDSEENGLEGDSENQNRVNDDSPIGSSSFGLGAEEDLPFAEDGSLEPAPADQWEKVWCSENFQQYGGTLCFNIDLIEETVQSYNPEQSCVFCEIEKINTALEETLAHSLVPNKATGNYLEAGKCKKVASVPLIDLQFNLIWQPVPNPTNHDLIYGSDVVDQWNKFLHENQPLLWSELTITDPEAQQFNLGNLSDFQTKNFGGDQNQLEFLNEVNDLKLANIAEAEQRVKDAENSFVAQNYFQFGSEVLKEMRQMNAYFESFDSLFVDIDAELGKILSKETE